MRRGVCPFGSVRTGAPVLAARAGAVARRHEAQSQLEALTAPTPGGPAPDRPAVDRPNPGNVDWQQFVQHADQLCAQGDFASARIRLVQAAHMRPGELQIVERLEDLELAQARQQLELAERQRSLLDMQDTAQDELVAQFQAHLVRQQIEVYAVRAERHPAQSQWKLALARSLKQAGSYHQACQVLEEVAPATACTVELHVLWGEALQHQQLWEPALDHYQRAAQAADPTTSDEHRLALYRSGILAYQLGQLEPAKTALSRLLAACPDYKDAQQHLDKIDSIRHKDGFP